MDALNIAKHALTAYAITLLLTQGEVFRWWRWLVRNTIGRLTPDYPVETCRMCQGVWVVAALWFSQLNSATPMGPFDVAAIYGFSYFLATQERT